MTRLKLSIRSPETTGPRQLIVEDFPFRIGRALENDLPLPYGSISGRHLLLEREDGVGFFVTDLGSTNGTFEEGQPLPARQRRPLRLPADLRLGQVTLRIEPTAEEISGFTMAQSSTRLRALVDEAARRSLDDDSRPFFEILSGPGSGRRHLLEPGGPDIEIGTSDDCQIELELSSAPNRLATISWRDGSCWFQSRTEQVLFDGEPLQGHRRLETGDRFVIGVAELLYFDPLQDEIDALTPANHGESNATGEMENRDIPTDDESSSPTDRADRVRIDQHRQGSDEQFGTDELDSTGVPTRGSEERISPPEEGDSAGSSSAIGGAGRSTPPAAMGPLEFAILGIALFFLVATVGLLISLFY